MSRRNFKICERLIAFCLETARIADQAFVKLLKAGISDVRGDFRNRAAYVGFKSFQVMIKALSVEHQCASETLRYFVGAGAVHNVPGLGRQGLERRPTQKH